MEHSKKRKAGRDERRELLEPDFGPSVEAAVAAYSELKCTEDDILDAFAALWTAERIESGKAQALPCSPLEDPFGLRMEIVA